MLQFIIFSTVNAHMQPIVAPCLVETSRLTFFRSALPAAYCYVSPLEHCAGGGAPPPPLAALKLNRKGKMRKVERI